MRGMPRPPSRAGTCPGTASTVRSCPLQLRLHRLDSSSRRSSSPPRGLPLRRLRRRRRPRAGARISPPPRPARARRARLRPPSCSAERSRACSTGRARQDRRTRLSQSSPLQRAAGLKGQKVASCGELSHTPCGSGLTAPVERAGYRYASFGENIYVGPWGGVSARDVVTAWLQSPGTGTTSCGPTSVTSAWRSCAPKGSSNAGPEVVWVATFGSRR